MKIKTHMRTLSLLVILAFSTLGRAQTDLTEIQKTIDRTVWKPFQKAFETLDAEALNETYADDVLRVTPNSIDTENSFKVSNVQRFNDFKMNGTSISLDFWFDSRHTNEDTSYEVGFYRIGATDKNGKTTNNYGQFHIVLRKIDGQWKIAQDWDTDTINGNAITQIDFEIQQPLKF